MKPVLRYQSQLLFRASYKPKRILRIQPTKLRFDIRPVRFGVKPRIKTLSDESTPAMALLNVAPPSSTNTEGIP